ncbi:MAG: RNA polymerase sigma factor [Candidatus Zixiibacteriota bacterium]
MIDFYETAVQAAQGDKKSEDLLFSHLFDRFYCLAKLRVWGNDAEDIAQDACLTIIEKLRAGGEIPTHFAAWAYSILRNKIGNYYQRTEVRSRDTEFRSESTSPEAQASFQPRPEFTMALEACMKELIQANRRYARVVNLVFQGFDVAEVSRKLQTPISNIYNILARGRRLLKHCLKRKV